MIWLFLFSALSGNDFSVASNQNNSTCPSSIITMQQSGGQNIINCFSHQPPPSEKIVHALTGKWEGRSLCRTGVEQISWNVTLGNDGQFQIRENYKTERAFFKQGNVLYDARWSYPLLILTANSITHYNIAVELKNDGSLSGQYFEHRNCSDIDLQKIQ